MRRHTIASLAPVGMLTLVLLSASNSNVAFANSSSNRLEQIATELDALLNAKAPSLQEEIKQHAATNAELKREQALYVDQLNKRIGALVELSNAKKAAWMADAKRYNDGVHLHNENCRGTTTSAAVYERCMAEKRHWDERRAQLEASRQAVSSELQAIKHRGEQTISQYQPRMEQIEAQMRRNAAALEEKRRDLEQLRQRVLHLSSIFAESCRNAQRENVPEALHYCQSQPWDRKGRGLPPLIDSTNRSPPLLQN